MITNHEPQIERLLISSESEVEELASQLADDYVDYFDIDLSHEHDRYQDSIEECLAHLEEVISALDSYKQHGEIVDEFVASVVAKNGSLNKLFDQVDAIEQYVFEMNRILDLSDAAMKELERHQSSKDSRIKQILHMIPGLSNMPRLGLFSGFSGSSVDDPPLHGFVEDQSVENEDQQQLKPINEILDEMKHIETTLISVTSCLTTRLYGETSKPSIEIHEPIATLSLDSPENVDGSWQELL